MSTFQFDLDFTTKRPPAVQEKIAEGMKAADDHADGRWKHWFDAAVLAAARKKPELTSDDVIAELELLPDRPSTHNLAAIGPAMRRAQGMGILEHTDGLKRSERPEKNGNLHRIWRSKVFQAS